MTHFLSFLGLVLIAIVGERRAKDFYQSFVYLCIFGVGVIGVLISLLASSVGILLKWFWYG